MDNARERANSAIRSKLQTLWDDGETNIIMQIVADTMDTLCFEFVDDLKNFYNASFIFDAFRGCKDSAIHYAEFFCIIDDDSTENGIALLQVRTFEDLDIITEKIIDVDFDVIAEWNTPEILRIVKAFYNDTF